MNDLKIIANPPYGVGNPDLKIQEKLLKVFPTAKIVFLQPSRVAEDPLFDTKKSTYNRYKCIFENINEIERVDTKMTNELFNIKTGSLGIYVRDFSNKKFDHEQFIRSVIGDGINVAKKIYNQMIDNISNHLQIGIPDLKFGVKVAEIRGFGSGDNYDIVSLRNKPFSSVKEYKHNKFKKADVTNNDKDENFVCFNSYEEANNFIEYTRTAFMHFLIKIFKRDVHVPLSALPYLSDYTHPWTDKTLYEYFKLTPEEISTIEEEMKRTA